MPTIAEKIARAIFPSWVPRALSLWAIYRMASKVASMGLIPESAGRQLRLSLRKRVEPNDMPVTVEKPQFGTMLLNPTASATKHTPVRNLAVMKRAWLAACDQIIADFDRGEENLIVPAVTAAREVIAGAPERSFDSVVRKIEQRRLRLLGKMQSGSKLSVTAIQGYLRKKYIARFQAEEAGEIKFQSDGHGGFNWYLTSYIPVVLSADKLSESEHFDRVVTSPTDIATDLVSHFDLTKRDAPAGNTRFTQELSQSLGSVGFEYVSRGVEKKKPITDSDLIFRIFYQMVVNGRDVQILLGVPPARKWVSKRIAPEQATDLLSIVHRDLTRFGHITIRPKTEDVLTYLAQTLNDVNKQEKWGAKITQSGKTLIMLINAEENPGRKIFGPYINFDEREIDIPALREYIIGEIDHYLGYTGTASTDKARTVTRKLSDDDDDQLNTMTRKDLIRQRATEKSRLRPRSEAPTYGERHFEDSIAWYMRITAEVKSYPEVKIKPLMSEIKALQKQLKFIQHKEGKDDQVMALEDDIAELEDRIEHIQKNKGTRVRPGGQWKDGDIVVTFTPSLID